MIKIEIPNNNLEERTYVLKFVFELVYGIKISISISSNAEYVTVFLKNGTRLVVKDCFFSKYPEPLSYLSELNIPSEVSLYENPVFSHQEVVIMFGLGEVRQSDVEIIVYFDLFASIFFMLTRWEEFVLEKTDVHGRADGELTLAVKQSFFERPVVNEYLDFLWDLIRLLDRKVIKKEHNFEIILSSDIDHLCMFFNDKSVFHFLKKLFSFMKYRNFTKSCDVVKSYVLSHFGGFSKDVYLNDFKWLLFFLKENELKGEFYFIPEKTDLLYDGGAIALENDIMKDSILKVASEGHFIGLHPGYRSMEKVNVLNDSISKLKSFLKDFNLNIHLRNRMHYLRYKTPETFKILESNDILLDSSIGYTTRVGFRSGVCFSYPIFDFLERKELGIYEQPLIVMDMALLKDPGSNGLCTTHSLKSVLLLKDQCKKYGGKFTILWHNSSFWEKGAKRFLNRVVIE